MLKKTLLASVLLSASAQAGMLDIPKYGSVQCSDARQTLKISVVKTHLNESEVTRRISGAAPQTTPLSDYRMTFKNYKLMKTEALGDDLSTVRKTFAAELNVLNKTNRMAPEDFVVLCEQTFMNDID